MKLRFITLKLLTWLLTTSAWAQFALNINGGFGSGIFSAGELRTIAARTPSQSEVFAYWQQQGGVAIDPNAWMNTLTMPANGAALVAVYTPLTAYTVQSFTVNGSEVRFAIPAGSAHTLLLRFHGTGGSAQNQFSPGENLFFSELALARGFIVASLDSVDRINKQWNPAFNLSNPDVQNVIALIEELRARGHITAATSVVAQGTSNGAAFSSRVSALLDFDAQALVIAAGINPIIRTAAVPTCWVLNQADSVVGPQAITDANASLAVLGTQGVRGALWQLAPSPVYPERFTRIRGLSLANSRAIYDALQKQGALDSNDYLLVNPADLMPLDLPPGFAAVQPDILDQLNIAYAEHQFSTNFMHRQLDFLEGRMQKNGFE